MLNADGMEGAVRSMLVPKEEIARIVSGLGWKWLGSVGPSDAAHIAIVRVQCPSGHTWDVSAEKLLARDCACPRCMRRYEKNHRKLQRCISRLRRFIKSRHGTCITDLASPLTFKGGFRRAEIIVRCAEGHEWKTHVDSLILRKTWCKLCILEARLEELRQLALQRGGRCLSESYTNVSMPMKWRCSMGHEWSANANRIKNGSWCPRCAGLLRLSIEEMQTTARLRGGECLSKVYVSLSKKLMWNRRERRAKEDDVCPEF